MNDNHDVPAGYDGLITLCFSRESQCTNLRASFNADPFARLHAFETISEPKPPLVIAKAARKLQAQFAQNSEYSSMSARRQQDILRRINMRASELTKAFFEMEIERLIADGTPAERLILFKLIDRNREDDGYLPRLCTWKYLADIHSRAKLLMSMDAK